MQENNRTSAPLDLASERRTERCSSRFRPGGRVQVLHKDLCNCTGKPKQEICTSYSKQADVPWVQQGFSPQEVRGLQESFERGTQGKDRDCVTTVGGEQVESVRTTTPVCLREFSLQPGSRRAQSSSSGPRIDGRGGIQRSPEGRTSTSRNIRLESSPARHSSTTPSRCSAEKSDASEYRNMWSYLNLGLTLRTCATLR